MTAGITLYSGLKIRIAAADTAMEIPTVAMSVELSKPGLPSTGRMKPRCIRYENAAATSTPNGSAIRIGRLRRDMVGVLVGEEQRDAGRFDLVDAGVDLLGRQGRKAERRLVDEQDLGPGHEAPTERKHATLAARESSRELAAALLEPWEQLVDP